MNIRHTNGTYTATITGSARTERVLTIAKHSSAPREMWGSISRIVGPEAKVREATIAELDRLAAYAAELGVPAW